MTTQITIENRDPAGLQRHPSRSKEPALNREDPEFIALVESLRANGIQQPLLVDRTGRVMDGWRRRMAARQLQLKSVPVITRPTEEASLIFITSLANRRHLTKSAIAYLSYPHLVDEFERRKALHLEKLAKSPVNPLPHSMRQGRSATAAALAETIGISTRLMEEARHLHKVFAEDKKAYEFQVQGGARDGEAEEMTLKDYFEPRILRTPIGGEHEQHRPMGLGAVIAGIAGIRATGGKPRREPEQLQLFADGTLTVLKRWNTWRNLDPAGRKIAWGTIQQKIGRMDDRLRDAVATNSSEAAEFYRRLAQLARPTTRKP